MDVKKLSTTYAVRPLHPGDVEAIFGLCSGNGLFYRYHPPFVTRESILGDMAALPPGKGYEDKYYVGFFKGRALLAVMDLILDYPQEGAAFIGFFMMDAAAQGKGIGTDIITECLSCLSGLGYVKTCLAIDRGNPQSSAFWLKNGFHKSGGDSAHIPMERAL